MKFILILSQYKQTFQLSTIHNKNTMPQSPVNPKILVENISCVLSPSENMGGLYLGNFYGAQNDDILQQYGIRAVIDLCPEANIKHHPLKVPFFKKVDAHDNKDYQISKDFDKCIEYINKHRKITNVLVHCYAGVSRSATVTIAYLMKSYKMDLKATLEFVKLKRIVAEPNQGFIHQLQKYEQKLFMMNWKCVKKDHEQKILTRQKASDKQNVPTGNQNQNRGTRIKNFNNQMQVQAENGVPFIITNRLPRVPIYTERSYRW